MIDSAALTSNLRVFRHLDPSGLSKDFVEKVEIEEGSVEWVDANRSRDLFFTEEIMANTIGAALVDAEGNIIAQWDGPDAFLKAEQAKSSARVTFEVDIDRSEAVEDVDPE